MTHTTDSASVNQLMTDTQTKKLAPGEYLLTDPVLLQDLRLARDVNVRNSSAILVRRFTLITPKLLAELKAHGIQTLFAEPIEKKTVLDSVQHMEKMFTVIEDIVAGAIDSIDDVADSFQNQQETRKLEQLVRNNLNDIQQLFKNDPTEKLLALTKHHSSTARHSIIASFHMMALGRELGWDESKIVKGTVSVFNHDVGKTKINLETLDWPGRLSHEQWKKMQCHSLFGGRLLYKPGEKPDLAMLTALLHHEWYAYLEGKGYGGLTLFADFIKRTIKLDIPKIVSNLKPDDLDIIQASSLVDMVSALEERRAYKQELDSFKVLIIMNSDAKLGHFHPDHYAAWHRIYTRQHPYLLTRGKRVGLPREKENRVFRPIQSKPVPSLSLLTYHELEQLGFLTVLRNSGVDVDRIRRRGGMLLKIIQQLKQEKRLSFDCSTEALVAAGVNPIKKEITPEEEVIELDAWREWLTWRDLERTDLLPGVRACHFDLKAIRAEGGISPERLVRRGLKVNHKKLKELGIPLLKPWTVRLPGSENRLTAEDLKKLGITDQQLERANCLKQVQKVKSSVPMAWLIERGIPIDTRELSKKGIDPIRKIFYDIQVIEEIDATRAKLIFLREGDDLHSLNIANSSGNLETIQDLLYNKIGQVVMDFADLIALPDLTHITMGGHWRGTIHH